MNLHYQNFKSDRLTMIHSLFKRITKGITLIQGYI